MNGARPVTAPRWVRGAWALSVLLGGALLLTEPAHSDEPAGLAPATMARYLSDAAGADARDIRVNGLYGSGHAGAWQFVAHITWLDEAGNIHGGTVTLPQQAGQPAVRSDFDEKRLRAEAEIGWSLSELADRADRLEGTADRLSLLELEIPVGVSGTLTSCHAAAPGLGECRELSTDGERRDFTGTLSDEPLNGALSVQLG
jgi:hypothetical protein